VIDCDVHCEVPGVDTLMPYLSRHWRARLTENAWAGPAGVAHCYPPLATGEPIHTLAQLRGAIDGADAAILTCYYAVEMIRHPDLTAELAAAVNAWLKEEWLDRDPRLRATLAIGVDYPEAAAAEIRRWTVDDGFVQVLMPVVAQRTYGNRAYFPIYAAAQEQGFVIGLHFGGVSGAPPTPTGWPDTYYEEAAGMSHVFQGQILSLVAEGVLQEFPSLRFSLLESGVTWLPSLLWRLDKMWKSYRREIPWVDRLPSTFLRERVRATSQPLDAAADPQAALEFLEAMDLVPLLMHASDAPHRHGRDAAAVLDRLDDERRDAVLHDHAAAWYGIG
jgi:uncharacterized protein